MVRYRIPELPGFSSYEDGSGSILYNERAALFATQLEGGQLDDWLLRAVGMRPVTARRYRLDRAIGLEDCCPNLLSSYLNGQVRVSPLVVKWSCSLTLGVAFREGWTPGDVKDLLLHLLKGEPLPDPISFEAGFRTVAEPTGQWTVTIPAHWDMIPSRDGFTLLPPAEGVRGFLTPYLDLRLGDGQSGRRELEGYLSLWRLLRRRDADGREREVSMELSFHFDERLRERVRAVAEVIWGSLEVGPMWPYIALGYMSREIDRSYLPSPRIVSPGAANTVPSSKSSPRSVEHRLNLNPGPATTSRPGTRGSVKFDPFKPSPFLSTIGKVLSSPWKSGGAGRGGGGKPAVTRPRTPKNDVSRFSWANSSTFYIDQDGSIRVSEFDDELVADEIGSDGTLYRRGSVVGRVEDGYVYDTEGNVVGRLDTSISDRWQVESHSQRVDPDTFGTDWSLERDSIRETDSPFVSSYGRDKEEEGEEDW